MVCDRTGHGQSQPRSAYYGRQARRRGGYPNEIRFALSESRRDSETLERQRLFFISSGGDIPEREGKRDRGGGASFLRLRGDTMRGVASPMFFALSLISALAAAAAHPESLLGIVPKVPNPESIRDGDGLYCESWKFSAETNNAGNWKTVPARCVEYVKEYMNGPRYAADCSTVTRYSIEYARNVSISLGAKAGKDAWIFDVDETLLSNLPYYRTVAYGYAPIPSPSVSPISNRHCASSLFIFFETKKKKN